MKVSADDLESARLGGSCMEGLAYQEGSDMREVECDHLRRWAVICQERTKSHCERLSRELGLDCLVFDGHALSVFGKNASNYFSHLNSHEKSDSL